MKVSYRYLFIEGVPCRVLVVNPKKEAREYIDENIASIASVVATKEPKVKDLLIYEIPFKSWKRFIPVFF